MVGSHGCNYEQSWQALTQLLGDRRKFLLHGEYTKNHYLNETSEKQKIQPGEETTDVSGVQAKGQTDGTSPGGKAGLGKQDRTQRLRREAGKLVKGCVHLRGAGLQE
jgi:hypothetical protein